MRTFLVGVAVVAVLSAGVVPAQLERVVAALTYVVNECREDIKTHCAKVEAGEGRIASSL